MRVAVVFGGRSTENYVSRLSAKSVINNIDTDKYEIVTIGITTEGKWFHYIGNTNQMSEENWHEYAEVNTEGKIVSGFERLEREDIDVIIPVLHGPNGEDGTVQGFFELLGKPYVGCGVLSSAISLDKAYTKIVCEKEGLQQCAYRVFSRQDIEENADRCAEIVERELSYPCFIKPSNAGSSVGISKASNHEELIKAFNIAAEYDYRVVAEAFVDGREIECAVLGNVDPQVAIPGEVIAANDFYDYSAKYFNEQSRTEVPANISEEQINEVKELAKRAYKCLDCRGLARVDFFLERKTGRFIFNEINTLPGFTNISMYSMMWNKSGIVYSDLIDRLIELAFENYGERKRKYTI